LFAGVQIDPPEPLFATPLHHASTQESICTGRFLGPGNPDLWVRTQTHSDSHRLLHRRVVSALLVFTRRSDGCALDASRHSCPASGGTRSTTHKMNLRSTLSGSQNKSLSRAFCNNAPAAQDSVRSCAVSVCDLAIRALHNPTPRMRDHNRRPLAQMRSPLQMNPSASPASSRFAARQLSANVTSCSPRFDRKWTSIFRRLLETHPMKSTLLLVFATLPFGVRPNVALACAPPTRPGAVICFPAKKQPSPIP
jgi:hypothetical protein